MGNPQAPSVGRASEALASHGFLVWKMDAALLHSAVGHEALTHWASCWCNAACCSLDVTGTAFASEALGITMLLLQLFQRDLIR